MLTNVDLKKARKSAIERLVVGLETQDYALEHITDLIPSSKERDDLLKIKAMLIEFIGKVEAESVEF